MHFLQNNSTSFLNVVSFDLTSFELTSMRKQCNCIRCDHISLQI